MTRGAVLLPLLLCAAAACGKKPEPPKQENPLREFTERLNLKEPCSRTIPLEWAASFPVPALQEGKLVYRVFFRGWEGNPKKGITLHGAEGDAAFTPDLKVVECRRRPGEPAKYPARERGMPDAEWERLLERLYALTETLAADFAAGRPADRAAAAEYAQGFAKASDPEQAADYRALNPDFWSWLEKSGGAPLKT